MEQQNIILLDEPTRGIDEEGIATFIEILSKLKKQNCAVIIASHDNIHGLIYNRELKLQDGILKNV